MVLTQKEESISFEIIDYQFPNKEREHNGYDYDANWLTIKITHKEDNWQEEFVDSCVLTYEISNFIKDLTNLLSGKIKNCSLDAMEPYLTMHVEKQNNLYLFELTYMVNRHNRERIKISQALNKSELADVIKNLQTMCSKYPERKS